MGKEIELLKDHAHLATHRVDVLGVIIQLCSVHHNSSRLMLLQSIEAANQGGLSGPGRAANHHALALPHRQVNVLQHLKVAKPLADSLDLDDGFG